MLTRRALIGSGFTAVGGRGAADGAQPPARGEAQIVDVVRRLDMIAHELRQANGGAFTGTFELGDKLREAMLPFLRAQQKYPDFIEVGADVFHQVYDWHVRNQLPLDVGRAVDGRYGIRYLFTRLILRTDSAAEYIGVPYDVRP
ncbi:MAG: hypothetical protein R2745_00120 [Vicinamibacterales bacterium]